MTKQFWAILIVIFAGMIAIFFLAGGKAPDDTGEFVYSENLTDIQSFDYVSGNPNVGTIIEYGDFECPACRNLYPVLQQLKQEYGEDLQFVFRHMPLTQIHRNALAAHKAAEAAGRQGKFFEMHDWLYENQESWNGPSQADPVGVDVSRANELFRGQAEALGLDMAQYDSDLESLSVNSRINADKDSGDQLGITGTPTFIVNGQLIEELPTSVDEFKVLLEGEQATE